MFKNALLQPKKKKFVYIIVYPVKDGENNAKYNFCLFLNYIIWKFFIGKNAVTNKNDDY